MKEIYTAHLKPEIWVNVNRLLIKKAISEFAHELILEPKKVSGKSYVISSDANLYTYTFSATKLSLDHWSIDTSSILKKDANSKECSLDAIDFVTEFRRTLGIPDEFLSTYIEEITSTLQSAAFKFSNQKFLADDLSKQGFQEIEHAMTEGHPCFVANNGRIGFNSDDYHLYTPEADHPFQIFWIAGHKKYATYTAVKEFQYNSLLKGEIGSDKVKLFEQAIISLGLNVSDYIFMPVHPWQWENKIIHVFAADIANQNIILVGKSDDFYSAQQSIRTLYNISNPEKLYTKTALSILNMGFMRGLSPYYMKSTPHITKWITELLESDSFLNSNGFAMLGEVATVGYTNHYYEVLGKTNPHNKMLSALWRESPINKIAKGQKVCTMAALLHLDYKNDSLLASFVKNSPVEVGQWIQRYLNAYLTPILHCFYKYEFVFMPHGENLILVLEDNVPQYALMKDITEEVIVFNEQMNLPEHADRLFTKTSDNMKILAIFTDIFDCFFRFLAEVLQTKLNFSEYEFWKLVASTIYEYQDAHPEFLTKYRRYDLFVNEFERCCLNRLQLANTKQMLALGDPIESLKLVGVLQNPISKFKR